MVDLHSSPVRGGYFKAALACLAATALTLPLRGVVDAANIVMIFLLVVALVAVRLGSGPAILAAFGGVALFDFFFVPPHFLDGGGRRAVPDHLRRDAGGGAGDRPARRASAREGRARGAARGGDARALRHGQGAVRRLRGGAGGRHRARLPRPPAGSGGRPLPVPRADETLVAIPAAQGGARCQDHVRAVHAQGRSMFLAAEESGYRPALALPLASPLRTRGVLLVFGEHAEQVCAAERRPLLDAVASLTAIVVERLHYGEVLQEVTLRMESERLRSALLSAVSHDLRTPLTVLVGMADALTLGRPALPAAALESAVAIREEALRLSELVHKLLDMARLQTGKLVLNKEWQPLEEVVGSSLKAMAGLLGEREIRVELAPDLPPLEFDAVLLERVVLQPAGEHDQVFPGRCPYRGGCKAQVTGDDGRSLGSADDGPGFPADRIEQRCSICSSAASAIPSVAGTSAWASRSASAIMSPPTAATSWAENASQGVRTVHAHSPCPWELPPAWLDEESGMK
jgi:two-component system sensor histidine kinase KdpD